MKNCCEKCEAELIPALIKDGEVIFLDKESNIPMFYNDEQIIGFVEHIVICKGENNETTSTGVGQS